jgi:type I restriction enzyme R subunit
MTTGVDAKTCKLVVLDQNIQSMTKFKQIIGRGTRIDDRYGKLWFSILDFKKATELFADENFDGDPVQVMEKKPEDIIEGEGDIDPEITPDDGITDINSPDYNTTPDEPAEPDAPQVDGDWDESYKGPITDDDETKPFIKFHISGVTVKKMAERVQYYDSDGKLVTESFKDYTRKTMQSQFSSLDDFVKRWNEAERKQTVIDELEQAGIIWAALEQEVGKELDPFDMICHVVYDQPALTRKERANNVRKRNYFTKYSDTAQTVLDNLLTKYADVGVQEIESKDALKVQPFTDIGRPLEIKKKVFGGKPKYEQAIKELESEIYQCQQTQQTA